MTLWSQDIISADVALTAKIPVFPYGECLLKCTADQVIIMQPMAIVKPMNNTDTADVEILNDANNNISQDQNHLFQNPAPQLTTTRARSSTTSLRRER